MRIRRVVICLLFSARSDDSFLSRQLRAADGEKHLLYVAFQASATVEYGGRGNPGLRHWRRQNSSNGFDLGCAAGPGAENL